MPLDTVQKRAIACVSVTSSAGTSRGTGFLVAEGGGLLTAFHAIGDRKTGELYSKTIRLAFGDPGDQEPFVTTAELVADRFSAAEDWALLRCKAVPEGAAAFQLARLEPGYELRWETYGFPDAAPVRGQVYGGVVRSLGSRIQLFSEEASAGESSRVRGLSGSPCIVHGRAVGIVLNANMKEDAPELKTAREGTLYARSIAQIAARCCELTLPAERPQLAPYVAQFLQPAAPHLLPELVGALGIPSGALSPDQLVREVAHQLLELGVKEACAALEKIVAGVPKPNALRILEIIAACSVHRHAADRLRQAFSEKVDRRAVCVNATRPATGERYVLRAGASYPGWKKYLRTVNNIGAEGQPAAIIAQVKAVLADALNCPEDELDSELDDYGHDDPPLVVVVPPPLPAPAVSAALRARFATARFVFLAGETVASEFPAEYPTVVVVEPLLVAEHEAAQERAFLRAQKRLDDAYRALGGQPP
ncbi:S1 family peptidase [Sorangium sp. So ce117]|uniref:S1 family peptidase n=1 Tax=Sorangium sp. So ce117 TaxID=3133277 RepID=UPI003F647DAB